MNLRCLHWVLAYKNMNGVEAGVVCVRPLSSCMSTFDRIVVFRLTSPRECGGLGARRECK
jgi:hypothetical protein